MSPLDRAAIIETIRRVLETTRDGATVSVQFAHGGSMLFQLPAAADDDDPAGELDDDELEEMERAILAAATVTVQPVKVLVPKAGYAYGSHSREAVRRLVDRGLLVRRKGGVCLPD